jgi:hypothetical protein
VCSHAQPEMALNNCCTPNAIADYPCSTFATGNVCSLIAQTEMANLERASLRRREGDEQRYAGFQAEVAQMERRILQYGLGTLVTLATLALGELSTYLYTRGVVVSILDLLASNVQSRWSTAFWPSVDYDALQVQGTSTVNAQLERRILQYGRGTLVTLANARPR